MRSTALSRAVDSMPLEGQLRMRRFFDLTSHLNVYEIKHKSDEIREQMEQEGKDTEGLVYGEIAYPALYDLIMMLKNKGYLQTATEKFLDLGSGVGKAMLMAAFIHPFEVVYGFELIPELHRLAEELIGQCREDCHQTRFEPLLGDYMVEPWPPATLILSNSTCLTRGAFENLMEKADSSSPGTIFISMSKAVHREGWALVESCQKPLHWGMCSFHVYVREQV